MLSRISRTQIFSLLSALFIAATALEITLPFTEAEAGEIVNLIAALVTTIGAIWGRMRADRPAGLLFKKD